MKLLTSLPSSSTLSFEPSFCHSKSATAGCLTTIFRRILCSGGLPTHPSDQIRELDSMSKMSAKVQELKTKQNTESTTTSSITPGLVERLMGLESMGERDTNTTIEATSTSSLSRSRSMNSVDNLREHKSMEGLHKRAKSSSSSSSLCEVPTFHFLENENFLVLNFESGCVGREFRSKGRRKETSLKERGELKKNKREKVHESHDNEKGSLSDMSCDNVANDDEHKLQFPNTSTPFMACSKKEYVEVKEVTSGGNVKRRKKGTMCFAEKKEDTECSSEDLSPVSIFDFERESSVTEVHSFGIDTSWRRKLSPELENDQLYVLRCDDNLMIEEREVKTIDDDKHEGSKRKEKQSQDCADIWVEICRVVDEELRSIKLEEGLRKQCDLESVCADFGLEIFDNLLNELIDQLLGDHLKALQLQSL